MPTSTSYKSKHFWWLVLKLLILIFFGYVIYHTLTTNDELDFNAFIQTLTASEVFSPLTLLILLIFTVCNWTVEISKWKALTNSIQSTSWKEAAQQSLASLTFSLITPNRIGEYGAKALYFSKEQRKNILLLNFIGNFHQLLVTLILGIIGIYFLRLKLNDLMPKIFQLFLKVLPITVGITVLILNFNKRFLQWRQRMWDRFDFITKKLNALVMGLSLIRYLIFSHQFYFLLIVFEVEISYWMAMQIITSMYLIASIIPMLSLFDFVLKGSIAVTLFSLLGISPLIILSITTLMWIFNFVLPAILGSYYVLTFKPVAS
jgi:uncharacterized membrane protein YbhN (UPF0104 family)